MFYKIKNGIILGKALVERFLEESAINYLKHVKKKILR